MFYFVVVEVVGVEYDFLTISLLKNTTDITGQLLPSLETAHIAGFITASESGSELFTVDMSRDNHSPGPEIRGASP